VVFTWGGQLKWSSRGIGKRAVFPIMGWVWGGRKKGAHESQRIKTMPLRAFGEKIGEGPPEMKPRRLENTMTTGLEKKGTSISKKKGVEGGPGGKTGIKLESPIGRKALLYRGEAQIKWDFE